MADYMFKRTVMTQGSEKWEIVKGGKVAGTVDLHYPTGHVVATIVLFSKLDDKTVKEIVQKLDDDVVCTADMEKGNFFVHAFEGRPVGTFQATARRGR